MRNDTTARRDQHASSAVIGDSGPVMIWQTRVTTAEGKLVTQTQIVLPAKGG